MTWSRSFEACTACGSSARPHRAKGLCRRCYGAQPEVAARHYEAKKRRDQSEAGRAKERLRYQRNREARIASTMARYHASPEYRFTLRIANLNYRARQAGREESVTPTQVLDRVEYFGARCHLCGGAWDHLDHVKPLAAGGPNLASNIRPACASCNTSKGNTWDGSPAFSNAA